MTDSFKKSWYVKKSKSAGGHEAIVVHYCYAENGGNIKFLVESDANFLEWFYPTDNKNVSGAELKELSDKWLKPKPKFSVEIYE